jgi:hypothetical protein
MRRLFLPLILLTITSLLGAQERRGGDWTSYPGLSGCIGGKTCSERQLRVPLEDRPVLAIRFHAHDQIGEKAGGELRVRIDSNLVAGPMDIPRRGQLFTIDIDELTGRALVFEPATNDEVAISEIAVLYARKDTMRRIPRSRDGRDLPGSDNGGWQAYPRAATCIGGDECRKNGNRIVIALEDAPVLGIRFTAHDAIGPRAGGQLSVRIDDTNVATYVDILRAGKRHEFDVDNLSGSKLVIETSTNDEVDVKDIEVLYGRRGRHGGGGGGSYGYGPREITHEGGCIGGSQCGGKRARIRIDLHGRPVEWIRLYARDDVGNRAGGALRIRIDDEVLEYALDILREGGTFTIDGKNIAGDYLYIEPAEDDEVVIKDIRVRFRDRRSGD